MPGGGREAVARGVGIGAALAVMFLFWRAIRWPAPAIAVTVGLGVYLLARPPRE